MVLGAGFWRFLTGIRVGLQCSCTGCGAATACGSGERRPYDTAHAGPRGDWFTRPVNCMKCQKCSKPATYHITDIERGKAREHHFCDEHAREHIEPNRESSPSIGAGKLAENLLKGAATLREPTPSDKQSCPLCQITYLEFRNSGRLGCPHDYEVFRDELLPLLENIHDETRHAGKVPRRAPQGTQRQAELIQLRNELKRAVAAENYEAAARVRDRIKELEQGS